MMSGFSGVLQLTDLDDFITPSQVCIQSLTFVICYLCISGMYQASKSGKDTDRNRCTDIYTGGRQLLSDGKRKWLSKHLQEAVYWFFTGWSVTEATKGRDHAVGLPGMFWLYNFGRERVGHTTKPGRVAEGVSGERCFKTGMTNNCITYLQVSNVIDVFRKRQSWLWFRCQYNQCFH